MEEREKPNRWQAKQQEKKGRTAKRQARLGIKARLVGMSVLPVVCLGIILTIYGQHTLRENMKDEVHDGLKSAAVAIQGAYDAAGQGEFRELESGNVIKGTFVVSGNYSLMDKMREESGIDASLFFGERQVVTSIQAEDGGRLLDLQADKKILKSVLEDGEEYFSEKILIGGHPYYGCYMPVKNGDGTVAGMIFTGKRTESVEQLLASEGIRMTAISAFVIGAAILATFCMTVTIVRALKHAMELFGKVAEGDLSGQGAKIQKYQNRNDEIGDMLGGIGKLRGSLQEIIINIQQSADTLKESAEDLEHTAVLTNQSSGEVGKAIGEVAKGAASQAEETGSAMGHVEQMGQMIGKIAAEIHELSERSSAMGRTGEEAARAIQELSDYSSRTSKVIKVIEKQTKNTNDSAGEIGKAVGMITEIAEETNLLSLNAAIEAARAGEQGKGFAIVATQIQKLSDQSSASAKQIERIIEMLAEDAKTAVSTMDEVVQIVEGQKQKLLETGKCFQEVCTGIQESLQQINGIRKQSEVLDGTRGQILQVVSSLSAISEENAAATEETTASTEELNLQMEKMTEKAVFLKNLAGHLESQIQVFQM